MRALHEIYWGADKKRQDFIYLCKFKLANKNRVWAAILLL